MRPASRLVSFLPLAIGFSLLPARAEPQHYQQPLQPNIHLFPMPPPPPPGDDSGGPKIQPAVLLGDILQTYRSLTTFSSFARLHSETESLLSQTSQNLTVLAPLNSAIDGLPRKPWEDPRQYEEGGAKVYEGDDGEEKARGNLRRMVEGHLVVATVPEGQDGEWKEKEKRKTVGGRELWWEKDGQDGRKVMPDGVAVDRVASRVANGEVWIIKGVLNYV